MHPTILTPLGKLFYLLQKLRFHEEISKLITEQNPNLETFYKSISIKNFCKRTFCWKSLEPISEDNWEEEANQRIEVLRKRNLKVNFNFDPNLNTDDLTVEIKQMNHSFPFGTAVITPRIRSCYDSNEDDNYCSFVRDNFNWLVDTYT